MPGIDDIPDLPFPSPEDWAPENIRFVASDLRDAMQGLEAGGVMALEGAAIVWTQMPDVIRWMELTADRLDAGRVQ